MSERSYTPGPWTIEAHGKGFALYSGRDNMHHGMNLVYLTEPDRNWEANARLIAAAPDLLAVLLEVMEDGLKTNMDSWKQKANAAIAKATGREE